MIFIQAISAVMRASIWLLLLTSLAVQTIVSHSLQTTGVARDCETEGALGFQQTDYSTEALFIDGQRKTLNCHAYNYCNIQWYRNGVDPFPWSVMKPDTVVLEDSNQSLIFNIAGCETKGNYTCIVSNATHNITRIIELKRKNDADETKKPFTESFILCKNRTACLGDNINFTCKFGTHEQFIGLSAAWYRNIGNSTDKWNAVNESVYRQITQKKSRHKDCNSGPYHVLFSTSLNFTVLSADFYGLYRVRAVNLQHQTNVILELVPGECHLAKIENLKATWILAVVLFCAMFVVATAGKTVSLPAQVWYKDVFGATEMNDGKRYDAYISYNYESEEDRIFVTQTLRNYLMKNFGYSVCIPEINILPGTFLIEEIVNALETSRRCIIVISPSYMASVTASHELDIAMDTMSSCMSCVIPVIFQDIADEDMCQSNLLKYVMKSSVCIRWNPSHKARFFKRLQLRMPPKPKQKLAENLVSHEVLPGGFATQLSQIDEISKKTKKKKVPTATLR